MSLSDLSFHAAEAFVRATEQARTPRAKKQPPALRRHESRPPLRLLSAARPALGTSVANELSRRLNWPVYDHELLVELAKDLGVETRLLEEADEKPASWLQEVAEAFAAVPTVGETTYFRHLLKATLSLAEHGECVIVGRGAAQLLRPPRPCTSGCWPRWKIESPSSAANAASRGRKPHAMWRQPTVHRSLYQGPFSERPNGPSALRPGPQRLSLFSRRMCGPRSRSLAPPAGGGLQSGTAIVRA